MNDEKCSGQRCQPWNRRSAHPSLFKDTARDEINHQAVQQVQNQINRVISPHVHTANFVIQRECQKKKRTGPQQRAIEIPQESNPGVLLDAGKIVEYKWDMERVYVGETTQQT